MKTLKQLKKYIASLPEKEAQNIIDENGIDFLINEYNPKKDYEKLAENKSKYRYNSFAINCIYAAFQKKGIDFVLFKGAALTNLLYSNEILRPVGDIDIYVKEDVYTLALETLQDINFIVNQSKNNNDNHHIVLTNGNIVVELHRQILTPLIDINEDYLINHIAEITLNNTKIKTFNYTATLLHLLYHLYMDTYLIANNKHCFIMKKQFGIARRFIFRAYEISLFSEKYFSEIKWEDVIEDIKRQKFHIVFNKMIFDILEIFPQAFPQKIIDVINELDYTNDKRGVIYRQILDANKKNEDTDDVLCNVIDKYWDNNSCKKIQIIRFGEFYLNNPVIKNKEIYDDFKLVCKACVEKTDEGVKLSFKVSNDDYCFSGLNEYDPQNSDGIHLIICGTEKYSYNSIFLFPKVVDDQIIAIPVYILDDERHIIDDALISAVYEQLEKEYIITVTIKNEFLNQKSIKEYFYLGLIVSDCSNKTKKRKAELILSEPCSEWGNPIYFAKIKLN